MGSKRFENFEQIQILIESIIFFNIPAQKFFVTVQRKNMRPIMWYVSSDYAAHFVPRTANTG
jgi:hypothetical protein